MLCASNGRLMSSAIVILDGGSDSVISVRPAPTLLLPSHWDTAPLPLAGPLLVTFMAGSRCCQGDHDGQLLKSLMMAKIFSGGALMAAERWMRKSSGRVAAKAKSPAPRATTNTT